MKTFYLLCAVLMYLLMPNMVLADKSHEFTVREYKLKFNWTHKLTAEHQDAFEIAGTVTQGSPCKKLEIQVAFSNDHYKEYIPVAKAFIENYTPDAKLEFRGEVPVKTASEHIPTWGIIDYAIKCLE